MGNLKIKIYKVLNVDDKNLASKIFNTILVILIIINVILSVLDTFNLSKSLKDVSYYIELISVIIFTVEYILRVWTSDLIYTDMPKYKARIKYIFSFMAIIDLLAFLPFYIPFIIKIDLRALRTLRLVRLLRVFKLNRYTNALSTIIKVFKSKASQLLSSVFVVSILMIISSIMMFYVENPAQPEVFKNAFSGLWWAVATLTTVGYGDIYPITVTGKILSGFIALLGIAFVAVPTGIISAGFLEEIEQKKEKETDEQKHYCPYCGKNID